jgi:hypothetical protein
MKTTSGLFSGCFLVVFFGCSIACFGVDCSAFSAAGFGVVSYVIFFTPFLLIEVYEYSASH